MRVGCSILFYGKLFYLWKESSNSILIFDIVFIILFDYYYFVHSIHTNRHAFAIKIINWDKMIHQITWSEVLKLWNSIFRNHIISKLSIDKKYPTFQKYHQIGKEFSKFSFEPINKIKDKSFKDEFFLNRSRGIIHETNNTTCHYYWNIIFKIRWKKGGSRLFKMWCNAILV